MTRSVVSFECVMFGLRTAVQLLTQEEDGAGSRLVGPLGSRGAVRLACRGSPVGGSQAGGRRACCRQAQACLERRAWVDVRRALACPSWVAVRLPWAARPTPCLVPSAHPCQGRAASVTQCKCRASLVSVSIPSRNDDARILTIGCVLSSAGGGASMAMLTMCSPRRMSRPSVLFCSRTASAAPAIAASSSSSSSAVALPASAAAAARALAFLDLILRYSCESASTGSCERRKRAAGRRSGASR